MAKIQKYELLRVYFFQLLSNRIFNSALRFFIVIFTYSIYFPSKIFSVFRYLLVSQDCQFFSPLLTLIINMFNCFSNMTTTPCKYTLSSKCIHYKEICNRLTQEEISILGLIFQDLATRISQKKLTFQNFLNFFNLTGLWGAKLFDQFDENRVQLISFEEFLYGISQTAKAPYEEKIRLLYLFFEDKTGEGIDFKNFTKMLYNYSKDQLKQILLRDELITQEPNTAIPSLNSNHKIVEVKIPESSRLKTKTSFDEAYQSLLDNHNEGTYLELDSNMLTYKIKYANMNSLIEQFAASVYSQNNIDVKLDPDAKLSYNSFSYWIKEHKKLFKSYYSVFHTDIWAYQGGQPSYMNSPIQFQFTGKLECGSTKTKVYAFQVGDVIVCCQSKKNKRKPIKIICLEGLNIHDIGNLGIEISHCSDCYRNSTLWFDRDEEHKQWLQHLKIYERDSLHENYITGQVIGNGKFSIVYKCIQKSSGKLKALKKMDLNKLTQRARKAISNQSEIMKVINHHQIVKYMQTLHTKTHEYIITEYIYGEDLFEYVRKREFLNQFQSAFVIGNIMKAVLFLHQLGIIHRDLKPENIMVRFVDKKAHEIFQPTTPYIRQGQRIQNIKIIDFGLANHISEIQKMPQSQKAAGTPNYIAPEILLRGLVTPKSDVFSIGSILYFLLRGRLPFASANSQKTLLKTVKGQYDMSSEHWDNVSEDAKDLLRRLLEVQPQDRISLEQAVNHCWFGAVFNRTRLSNSECSLELKQNKETVLGGKFCLQEVHMEEYQRKRKESIRCKNLNEALLYR